MKRQLLFSKEEAEKILEMKKKKVKELEKDIKYYEDYINELEEYIEFKKQKHQKGRGTNE